MTSCPDVDEEANTDSALFQFLKQNNLQEICSKFLNEGYKLDDLKQIENENLNNICKQLNISTKHKLKLKNALYNLKSNTNVLTQKVVSDKLPQSYALLLTTQQLSQLRDLYQKHNLVSKYITNASNVYENECKTNEQMLQNFVKSQQQATKELLESLIKVLKQSEKDLVAKYKTFLDEKLLESKENLKLEKAKELQSSYNNTKTMVEHILSNTSGNVTTPEMRK